MESIKMEGLLDYLERQTVAARTQLKQKIFLKSGLSKGTCPGKENSPKKEIWVKEDFCR